MTRIARVQAFPLRYPDPHDGGKLRCVTLARVETEDGVVGWGEAIANPPEAALATKVVIDAGLAALLVGQDPSDPRRLWRALRRHSGWSGHGGIVSFAISALDIAVWDVAGKLAGQPVHRLLGGKLHDRVRVCSSVILNTLDLDALADEFRDYRARGYTAMKGGWGIVPDAGFGTDPTRDLAIARTLRDAVGPENSLTLDVSGIAGWTDSHAVRMAKELEEYRLGWLEDPLHHEDHDGYRRIRAAVSTPIATGERCWTQHDYRRLVRSRGVDIVLIDPGRVEGISGVKAIADDAASEGVALGAALVVERDQHRCGAARLRGDGERPRVRAQAERDADAARARARPVRPAGRLPRCPRCAGPRYHRRRGRGAQLLVRVSASSEHRPSIREVAKLAGVATSTVSRVMNSHIDVSPRMRERVYAAVRDLGYRPDILAQGLRTKTTRAIGVIVSDIADPLLAAAVTGVERGLRAAGYAVYLANLERDVELDLESIRLLAQRRVDGLILGLSEERYPATAELLRAANVPLVLLDRDLPAGVPASRVVFDHGSSMQRATRTLLELGHREIALIVGDVGRSAHERESALLRTVAAAGPECHCRVYSGALSAEFGEQATQQLLDSASAPTALIAGGRLLLHGALRVCRERELQLGVDLSLVGCDDDELAELHVPPIAVIVSDPVAIGVASAELLLEVLDGVSDAREVDAADGVHPARELRAAARAR